MRLRVDDQEIDAEIIARRPQLRVRIGDRIYTVTGRVEGQEFELTVDGNCVRGWRCTLGAGVQVRLSGRTYAVQPLDSGAAASDALAEREIRASMPGVVVAVHCAAGRAVAAGEKLLTLESMKLQVTLLATHAAVVEQVHVAPEAVFERGALLVSLAPAEGDT
jgi:acetyl/propionyl-CoA carboxylase alpha subunit